MATRAANMPILTFKDAFEADRELIQYGPNALAIFALSLYLRIEDVPEFAADAITEGGNDKKIDICHIDESEGRVVVAQSYFSPKWNRPFARSDKASSLNTGVAWLLCRPEEEVPPHMRAKAIEVRRALASGAIKQFELLFIHNCLESLNAETELRTVAAATRDIIATLADPDVPVVVSCQEFGLTRIEELYQARDKNILIEGWLDLPIDSYVEERGPEWRAILATIPGSWIQTLFEQHGDRLFSANYRDYLGSIRRRGNINFQMTQTADSEPENFWVYNNGITALTYELRIGERTQIRGISILNGAQTTGAISAALPTNTDHARVPIRVVECGSRELVDKIIRYNNTQNEIKPADRRSSEITQIRLKQEFARYNIIYAHRRSAVRVPRNAITAEAMGPALCAFHGDPQTAYRNAGAIFDDDNIFNRVFPNNISAEHVFLVRTLSMAIDSVKSGLKACILGDSATEQEQEMYDVLKYSASKHFMFYIIGAIAEEIMQRRVSDLFEWRCIPGVVGDGNNSMKDSWIAALEALLPFIKVAVEEQEHEGESLKDPYYEVPRSDDLSKKVIRGVKAAVRAHGRTLSSLLSDVRIRTSV